MRGGGLDAAAGAPAAASRRGTITAPVATTTAPAATPPFARQLRHWRARRRWSQLDLAGEAEVSSRHLSFLETGRSRPSREMVLRLAGALDLPLRERNELLLAAGYAPLYGERSLDDPRLRAVRDGLAFLLLRHEPYPAFVIDRGWNVRLANQAYFRFAAVLGAAAAPPAAARGPAPSIPPAGAAGAPLNALRLVLDPAGLRPALVNWPQVARVLAARLERELRLADHPAELVALRDEVLRDPEVRAALATPLAPDEERSLLVPIVFRAAGRTLSWYSTIASFGAPLDVTLQEARIESLLPADEETRRFAEELARGGG
jgi:transcriptional regulator with XRE-family HTH domain